MNNKYLFADISDYQSTFDALSYRSAGHERIAIKAGEGLGTGGGSGHATRSRQAHDANLEVWHYWFLRPAENIREQALLLAKTVAPVFGHKDRVVIDTEDIAFSPDQGCKAASDMKAVLVGLGHPHAIFYTYLAYVTNSLWQWEADYWIAEYNGNYKRPALDKKFNVRWKQYTDSKHGAGPYGFAGIGPCDGNIVL